MKYKLLLFGKNQTIIDDFFYAMEEEFECMTTSIRSGDILNHIKYFTPDVLVYCITEDTWENFVKLVPVLNAIEKQNLKIILLGDSEVCDEFVQLRPKIVALTLYRPISASSIKQQLVQYFVEKEAVLKAEQEAIEQEKLRQEAEMAAAAAEEPKNILVIDDDPIMLRLIKEELKDEYNVATAISGKVGLKFLERKKTDLILLDYEMPGENGPEILEKIRANETLRDIPVVFLTGINEREKIQKVIAMKPQGYLLKPIEHDKLVQIIRQVIG